MPRYEFLCEKCRKPFESIMRISEREKAKLLRIAPLAPRAGM